MRKEMIATYGNWSGKITIDNIDLIYERIKKTLDGKRYSYVTSNFYYPNPRPEIRTSQSIIQVFPVNKDDVHFDKVYVGKYASFQFRDQHYTWGWSTYEYVGDFGKNYKQPHIVFNYDKFTVESYASAGNLIIDVVAVEDHERYT